MRVKLKKNKDGSWSTDKEIKETEIEVEIITAQIKRSEKQNRWYWDVVLPTCRYYLDMDHCYDKNDVHLNLKINYCAEVDPSLIITRRIKDETGEVKVRSYPFSWSFLDMPQKHANRYLEWISSKISKATGIDGDDVINDAHHRIV
jgi:hypothetical protein